MTISAIIFDFDGVIADSEMPANRALAESLTAIGLPTSFEDALATYYGHNWQETERRATALLGRPLPVDFRDQHRVRARAHFADGFAPVPGAEAFIAAHAHLPRAIASSSRIDYIRWALERFGLADAFAGMIHSADGMDRPKPYPDIYLQAAAALGTSPADCLAIEDSPTGARAALAAGMRVVGLCAAGHIGEPSAHGASLAQVGVQHIAMNFDDISRLIAAGTFRSDAAGPISS
jgi:HAD superfamily hydrolase (TIGR01509 family)